MGLTERVALVKASATFREAVEATLPWLALPATVGMMLCPVPEHVERTASCSFREDYWFCHGCHHGGDAFSLVQAVQGLTFVEALEAVEGALGVVDNADQALLGLAVRRVSPEAQRRRWGLLRWRARVDRVEQGFRPFATPYLRSPNLELSERAAALVDPVFDALSDESMAGPAATPLTDRVRLRRLERFAADTLATLDLVARRDFGLDRLDVLLLDPLPRRQARQLLEDLDRLDQALADPRVAEAARRVFSHPDFMPMFWKHRDLHLAKSGRR